MKINEFVENKDFLKIKNDIDSFLFYRLGFLLLKNKDYGNDHLQTPKRRKALSAA